MAHLSLPVNEREENEATSTFYASLLIGFHQFWYGGLALQDQPGFGHSALPSTIIEIERMRAHMLAERHAWENGRVAIGTAWTQIKVAVLPPALAAAAPVYLRDAYDVAPWVLPNMDGKVHLCLDTSLAYLNFRSLPACIECSSR